MKRKVILAVFAIVGIFFGVLSSNDVYADVDTDSTVKKWVFTQYYNCMNPGGANAINEMVTPGNSGKVYESIMRAEGQIYMPSYNFGNQLNNSPINCRELLGKDSGNTAVVLDYYSGGNYKDATWSGSASGDADALMTTAGYYFDSTATSGPDWQWQHIGDISIQYQVISYQKENDVVVNNTYADRGKHTAKLVGVGRKDNKLSYYTTGEGSTYFECKIETSQNSESILEIKSAGGPYGYIANNMNPVLRIPLSDTDIDVTVRRIQNALSINTTFAYYTIPISWGGGYTGQEPDDTSYTTWEIVTFPNGDHVSYTPNEHAGKYVFGGSGGNTHSRRLYAINYLSGRGSPGHGNNYYDVNLTDTEKYNLYFHYLNSAALQGAHNRFTCDPSSTEGLTTVDNIKDSDGEFKTCYVNLNGVSPGDITVYIQLGTNSTHDYPYIAPTSLVSVLDFFSRVNTDELGEIYDIADAISDADMDIGGTEACYDKNLNGQGWILCPVLSNSTTTAEGISGLIEEWLAFDPAFLDVHGEGEYKASAYTAWEIARDMANVLMIVILLVVVFSQLTGYGIDNYGVKKILPRIITMAIVINLSYYFCAVLIDLSNILGTGLDEMFKTIGIGIGGDGATKTIASIVGMIMGAGAGAGAAAGTVISIIAIVGSGSWIVIIIALIIVLIIALVAFLELLILLGARLVIILMFTVISPLAFACYVLPNTQGLFKKWWSVLKTALIVYPICGAIHGLSYIIKGIIFSGGMEHMKFWMALVAVFVPYLPFLMIPSMLKGVLAGLGKLGAAIGMVTSGLRSGVNKGAAAIRNTEMYKNAEKRGRENLGHWQDRRLRDAEDRRIMRGLKNEKDKKTFSDVLGRIRNGTATDEDREAYNDLRSRSKYNPSENRQRMIGDTKARIEDYESRRDKAHNEYDDIYMAGQRQSNLYSANKAYNDAEDWGGQFFRDNDGNVWTSDGKGNYHTIDKDGKHQSRTAAQIAQMSKDNKGKWVSRREAALNRDMVSRAKETGQLAGYANRDNATSAAGGTRLSSYESSRAEIDLNRLSNDDNVLQIQHDDNLAKQREIQGKANARGATDDKNVVASVEVYTQRAQNDYNLAKQNNRLERTQDITPEFAEVLVKQRFDTAQEKLFAEQLVNNTRTQSMEDLNGAVTGTGGKAGMQFKNDPNYIRAAMKDVVSKGGIQNLNEFIVKNSDAINGNDDVRNAVNNYMATLVQEPVMKTFGKYASNETNPLSYFDWLNADDNETSDPDGKRSLAGFIRVNGDSALVNATKDTAKFYSENPDLSKKFSAIQIVNGAVSAKDNETRNAFDKWINNNIKTNADRGQVFEEANSATWASMDKSTFDSFIGASGDLREFMKGTKKFNELDKDTQVSLQNAKKRVDSMNGSVKANMAPDVSDFFEKVPEPPDPTKGPKGEEFSDGAGI